jgi:hypothetical protein
VSFRKKAQIPLWQKSSFLNSVKVARNDDIWMNCKLAFLGFVLAAKLDLTPSQSPILTVKNYQVFYIHS